MPRSSASRPRPSREIYRHHARCWGTVLENVSIDPQHRAGSISTTPALTENTRAAYPLAAIPNASRSGHGGDPEDTS